VLRTLKNVNKLLLFLLVTIFPLSAMAEEIVISPAYIPHDPFQKYSKKLNLKYEPEFDFEFCVTNAKFCDALKQDQTKSLLPKFEMYKRPKDWQWSLFWTLQALDVLTTSEGLGYDCISELNPLLGERPSTLRLVAHKGIIFGTSWNNFIENTSENDLTMANFITGVAVINNIDVINSAKRNCNQIR